MNFEPQKLFVGLIDFFSILLPGALLTFALKDRLESTFLRPNNAPLPESALWAIFLFSSYLLGHLIFLIGAKFLDDIYDDIRTATYQHQLEKLARGQSLSSRGYRLLATKLFRKQNNGAVRQAVSIKKHYLDPLRASEAINAFQWAKARLTLNHPEAIATVQRFEADSKFFRSLLVVLYILMPLELYRQHSAVALICAALLIPAFWRYVDQRFKATEQAYWYVITAESQSEHGYRYTHTKQLPQSSHAGGVVYRVYNKRIEYLLVQAKNTPNEWVLPKGHIESEELTTVAAVREVREETGVWARIDAVLESTSFSVNAESITVQFYLMHALAETTPTEKRAHTWLPFDTALTRVTHPENQEMLKAAEQKRKELGPAVKRSILSIILAIMPNEKRYP